MNHLLGDLHWPNLNLTENIDMISGTSRNSNHDFQLTKIIENLQYFAPQGCKGHTVLYILFPLSLKLKFFLVQSMACRAVLPHTNRSVSQVGYFSFYCNFWQSTGK